MVLPATTTTRRVFRHAEILDTTRDHEALLAPLETPVTLQRVTDEQYREYVHALQVSTEEPASATGPWEFAEDHGQAAVAGAPLTVRVTSADATQDPGNPFPALLAGVAPTPAAAPLVPVPPTSASSDATEAEDTNETPAEPASLESRTNPRLDHEIPPQRPGLRTVASELRSPSDLGTYHAHDPAPHPQGATRQLVEEVGREQLHPAHRPWHPTLSFSPGAR
ncbi:hypothetical protein [Streptomyces sp. H27-S2]|uniref:hypothetical protein n=1 Tax=Streptomyces antarcticus TaxID=2996458 RepID=UPI003B63C7A8